MRITILGTRGNIEPSARRHSKHSGILIDGFLLFDVGEKAYLKLHPKYVFITHLHSDHAAIQQDDVPEGTVVYGPESAPLLPEMRVMTEPVRVGAYTVTPIPTVHSQRVKSVAYLVEKGSERVLYSSDLVKIKTRFRHLLLNLDLVVTEGSFIRSGGLVRRNAQTGAPTGHNGIPNLVAFFSRFTRRIVITHFGSWFFRDIGRSRRKIESLGDGAQVIPAYDGMQISV